MKKAIIGLDYDGVTVYRVLCRLLEVIGIDEVVIGKLFEIVCSQKWLRGIVTWMECFFVRPMGGAIKHIGLLLNDGHKIMFITSRGPFGCAVAKECVRKMFGYNLEVIGVGWKNSKLEATRKFKLDIFVDDTLHKLKLLVGYVPYLFLFSWKRGREQEVSIVSVFSWKELYDKISDISFNENIVST